MRGQPSDEPSEHQRAETCGDNEEELVIGAEEVDDRFDETGRCQRNDRLTQCQQGGRRWTERAGDQVGGTEQDKGGDDPSEGGAKWSSHVQVFGADDGPDGRSGREDSLLGCVSFTKLSVNLPSR